MEVIRVKNHAREGQRPRMLRYTVYFERVEDGAYQAVFPSIPEIVTFGANLDEARQMAMEALLCHIEGLEKDDEPLPVEQFDTESHRETLELPVPADR